jgi:DNA-binding CsgD family transcriptional regulator
VFDLYPNPLPPPAPPVTRDDTLAAVQTGFASLTDDEVKVARLWLIGKSFNAICSYLQMDEKVVRSIWRSMRRKLRDALKEKGHGPT